jgi:cytochrome c peroxidase
MEQTFQAAHRVRLASIAGCFALSVVANTMTSNAAAAGAPASQVSGNTDSVEHPSPLDRRLRAVLREAGFTGRVEAGLESRLGRELDQDTIELGRSLFFDTILGLHDDNSCAGCHSPAFGFGDSQPMAMGVDNNGIVGSDRATARNQRRSPLVANTEFYPAMMWTARFVAVSGDPFDASQGFRFPPPENLITSTQTLLQAQGSLPSTELVEMAGFTGITENPGSFGPEFIQFDNGQGEALPPPDETGFHNFPIQDRVNARLNDVPAYRALFGKAFNDGHPLPIGGITIDMRRVAMAEFQMSLPGADAPLDRYARGDEHALTEQEKRGALLFFGAAGCVACHAVGGGSNEMFSDFQVHRVAGPQLFPQFGVGLGNVHFDGPGHDEDFGIEQTSGDSAQRYMFRTAPLRNLAVAPAFFHNGAFGSIRAAIRHHLDVVASARNYDPAANHLPSDLTVGPIEPVLAAGIDPLLAQPKHLSAPQFNSLVAFVTNALLDERVLEFCDEIPNGVASGRPLHQFEGCD